MNATSNKLTVAAHGDREIRITREFDAPRALVFDAHTKPELVRRWLGVRSGWTMPVCEIDLRVGGTYRYVWRQGKDGHEMGMGGVFREVARPERLVCTEKFDDPWYPGEGLNTIALTEKGGRTTMEMTTRYESKAARDAVLASPMATGLEESYAQLDALAAAAR
jgi:uncharacterized protein YndB with AHSA1/START domain